MSEGEFERLVLENEPMMIRTMWRILQHPHDAEDAYHDVLVAAWNKRSAILTHANPRALLLRICANAAYDAIRRRRPRSVSLDEAATAEPSHEPHQRLADLELGRRLWEAVGQLPRNQAIAVSMRIIDDCRFTVIADALQCKEATARQHFYQGRQKLGEQLRGLCPDCVFEEAEK